MFARVLPKWLTLHRVLQGTAVAAVAVWLVAGRSAAARERAKALAVLQSAADADRAERRRVAFSHMLQRLSFAGR